MGCAPARVCLCVSVRCFEHNQRIAFRNSSQWYIHIWSMPIAVFHLLCVRDVDFPPSRPVKDGTKWIACKYSRFVVSCWLLNVGVVFAVPRGGFNWAHIYILFVCIWKKREQNPSDHAQNKKSKPKSRCVCQCLHICTQLKQIFYISLKLIKFIWTYLWQTIDGFIARKTVSHILQRHTPKHTQRHTHVFLCTSKKSSIHFSAEYISINGIHEYVSEKHMYDLAIQAKQKQGTRRSCFSVYIPEMVAFTSYIFRLVRSRTCNNFKHDLFESL